MAILSADGLVTTVFQASQPNLSIDSSDMRLAVESLSSIVVQTAKTADYTIALTDRNTLIPMNSAAAHTFFINTDAAVAFEIGAIVYFWRRGTGSLTITATTPGTTTILTASSATARAQFSVVTAQHTAANEWLLGGDLT
jgi:hypothetical protein